MFRALLTHIQEAPHKRHGILRASCLLAANRIAAWSSTPILLAANWHNTHAIYRAVCVAPPEYE
jgi:hypothetical protein